MTLGVTPQHGPGHDPGMTLGEALAHALAARGVEIVFGIPGVHTIELYRGLTAAGLRHVTPRHEQGAGFMADGYARVSGRPGVAFVITGPGLTNILTPMAQARADSVPMLVVSGAGRRDTLGRGLGHLHELPDQRAVAAGVALESHRIDSPDTLATALDAAFARFAAGRPGPVHLEIPLDAMTLPAGPIPAAAILPPPEADPAALAEAVARLSAARAPVILAGGGARRAPDPLRRLAERLDAPVVTTTNARGLLHAHPLGIPASPSLGPVRALLAASDAILAVGTELGPTDYDMYGAGGLPDLSAAIRIDIDAAQLARHPAALTIRAAAETVLPALLEAVPPRRGDGPARAARAREGARAALDPDMRARLAVLETIRDTLPGSIVVGDSTQPVYAGNLFHDHDRPGGWFNAATGYGALGYGAPAAIGAQLADPSAPVVCLTGDGGLQFTLAELGTAAEERLPVLFLVWNNRGYAEIAEAMAAAGVPPIGVTPTPPDFAAIAAAFGLPFHRTDPAGLAATLRAARAAGGPALIEIPA